MLSCYSLKIDDRSSMVLLCHHHKYNLLKSCMSTGECYSVQNYIKKIYLLLIAIILKCEEIKNIFFNKIIKNFPSHSSSSLYIFTKTNTHYLLLFWFLKCYLLLRHTKLAQRSYTFSREHFYSHFIKLLSHFLKRFSARNRAVPWLYLWSD